MHQLESFESNYMKYWGFLVLEAQLCLHHFVSVFLDWTPSHEQLLCTDTTILTGVHTHDSWLTLAGQFP